MNNGFRDQEDNVNLATPYKATVVLGVMTILLWSSYLFYLPPFLPKPNVREFSKETFETREFMPRKYESQQEIERDLNKSPLGLYIKGYLTVAVGIISGILLLARNRYGTMLAILMSLLMIGSRIIGMFKYKGGILGWFNVVYGYSLFLPIGSFLKIRKGIFRLLLP
jgi:hypothetical protein